MEREKMRRSLMTQANTYIGICEKLRMIYDIVYEIEDKEKHDKITELLIDCMLMSKKIIDRLEYYKSNYKDTTGSGGSSLVRNNYSGGLRKFRKLRPIK